MMTLGTEKAFELSLFFLKSICHKKEPNRPQQVVTSGCEVITSGPKKMCEKGFLQVA